MARKNTKQVSKVYIKPTTLAAARGRTYLRISATGGDLGVRLGQGTGEVAVAEGGYYEPYVAPNTEITVTSMSQFVINTNIHTEATQWMQTPPTLVNPLVVSDYDLYGTGDATRVINGGDGDVLLLAHSPAGGPAQTLFNTKISVYNFRRLHVYGLDLEVTDPLLTTRVLQIKTSSDRTTTEEVFIEGLSMEHNFIADSCDAIVVLNLGVDAGPVSRFVLQSSRITGVGVPTNSDGPGVHPDIMQMQGNTRIDNVYIENFTGTTMYQGLFLPWNQNTSSSAFAPEYALRNVNISSEDSFTHRLFTTQDEGYTAAEYPITSFDNVYLSQGQTHSFGVGPSEIHVDPLLYDDSPFEFVAAARITGLPTTGRAPADFSSRARVGINYASPHGLPVY